MTKQEFLDVLNSKRISQIRSALESGYIPKYPEEIEALCQKAVIAHTIFQEQILQIALRSRRKLAIPLLCELARVGIAQSIREGALDELLQCSWTKAGDAILNCASDEDLQIQRKAFQSLRGRNDPRAIELLIDRCENPKTAILANKMEEEANVRTWAINSLATKGATQAIQPLVELMLEHKTHRAAIINTLGTIGAYGVVEALLDAVEGRRQDIPPDQAFKLEAVRAIGAVGFKRFASGDHERYRNLLSEVYPTAVTNISQYRYLLEETAKHLDSQLSDVVREEFAKHQTSDVAAEIIKSMRNCNLPRGSAFWFDVFDIWHPSFQAVVKGVFLELAREHRSQMILFLRQAVQRGGPKNNRDRLPAIIQELEDDVKVSIFESLAPMLDREGPRQSLPEYFKRIWDHVPAEKREALVKSLVHPRYRTKEALNAIAIFFAPRWTEPCREGELPKSMMDILSKEWKRRDQKDKVASIIGSMAEHVDDKGQWCLEMARQASEDLGAKKWPLFKKALEGSPEKEESQAIQEVVSQRWQKKLLERLIGLDKEQAVIFLREHLDRKGDERLKGSHREWALWAIGENGNQNDFERLAKEAEGPLETCAVAAVRAIGRINANTGQTHLCEALKSRKTDVVMVALQSLENVSDLKPETIRSMRERTGDQEKDAKIRMKAQAVFESLRNQHLENRPNVEDRFGNIQVWLATLHAFGRDETIGKILEEFLKELGEREAPETRIALGKCIEVCCPPEMGIRIAEAEMKTERRSEVLAAWEEVVDSLKGLPDRGVFHLIEWVRNQKVDRTKLLGKWGLEEIFLNPSMTLMGLRKGLRRAEAVKEDPDTLVTVLDATAELLIDELLYAAGKQPERYVNQYGNKIGITKSISNKAARHAEHLHSLRESAIGPHAKDSAGELRAGVTLEEAGEARIAFSGLFEEVILFLRSKKEESAKPSQ